MPSIVEQAAVERSLEKILADEKFNAAPQMSAFLNYVVRQTLLGDADRIKAYTVAVDALGKLPTFDPQNDPSVRVLAKRLRTSLEQYYQRTTDHEMIIEIKCGSYKPIFHKPSAVFNSPNSNSADFNQVDSTPNPSTPSPATHSLNNNQPRTKLAEDLQTIPVHQQSTQKPDASAASAGSTAPSEATKNYSTQPIEEVAAKTKSTKHSPTLANALLDKSLLNKIPRSALVIAAAFSLLIWTIDNPFNKRSDTNPAYATAATPYQLQLASNNVTRYTRERPDIPTLVIQPSSSNDVLAQSLVSSISHVLSKFDSVQLLDSTHEYDFVEKWPEDYQLSIGSLIIENQIRITAKMLHAKSGRVAHIDTLSLEKSSPSELRATDITAIEEFAAQFVQTQGPLLRDYRAQGDYSTTMTCIFELANGDEEDRRRRENCVKSLSSNGWTTAQPHVFTAELKLNDMFDSKGQKREAALEEAIETAHRAVKLSPYSANAHVILMRALHEKGEFDIALEQGNLAITLNSFDGANLNWVAQMLEDLKHDKKADDLRQRALRLNSMHSQSTTDGAG